MKKMIGIFIAGLATVFLTLHVAAQQSPATQNDTLCISSAGTNNRIIINEEDITRLNDCTGSLAVKGEIIQKGQNNNVEINTKRETPNNKNQITNKSQNPKNKNQTEPATCTQKPATIKIKQTGKNNTVKINSR